MPDSHGGPQRRSIRLPGYDYSDVGAYFVTVCTHHRECRLGEIVKGAMRLSEAGRIVTDEWAKSAEIRPEIELDAFVVMPNHLHAIVWVQGAHNPTAQPNQQPHVPAPQPSHRVCRGDRPVARAESRKTATEPEPPSPSGPRPRSLGALVAGFKSAATTRLNRHLQTPGAPLWQRNYYEHIIRNDTALHAIRTYIRDNPMRWAEDPENPSRAAPPAATQQLSATGRGRATGRSPLQRRDQG